MVVKSVALTLFTTTKSCPKERGLLYCSMKYTIPCKTFILFIICLMGFNSLSAQETLDTLVWNDTVFAATTAQLKSDTIPRYVFEITGLKKLTIAGQDCDEQTLPPSCWMIKQIPPAIKNVTHLHRLSLALNAIQSLPAEIGELKELYFIDLTDNGGLTDIRNLVNVENLQELYLDGCGLKKVPDEIRQLKNLRVLSLVDNDIPQQDQARIKNLLPNCKIDFGTPESEDEK
jgi:Leucine-rich repeat (LRR) protein